MPSTRPTVAALLLALAGCAAAPTVEEAAIVEAPAPLSTPAPHRTAPLRRSPPAVPPASDWALVESDDGAFEIRMPKAPQETRSVQETALGGVPTVMWMLEEADRAFAVVVADYPSGFMDDLMPQEVLKGARDGALANIQGTLVRDVQVFADRPGGGKVPGREIVAEIPTGQSYRARLFLAGDRLYQIAHVSPSAGDDVEFRRLVASFRLR